MTLETALTPQEKLYLELGDFIWDGIPYDYDSSVLPKIGIDEISNLPSAIAQVLADETDPKTSLDGPAKDFGGKNPVKMQRGDPPTGAVTLPQDGSLITPITEESLKAQPWLSLWWTFGGNQYRVTKAMMIPYSVTNTDGTKATRHFLVGYMGVDSHG
jgi:hypothetical protein